MIVPFRPFPLLQSGKIQTIMGYSLPANPWIGKHTKTTITLEDGDRLLIHIHPPKAQKRFVVMIHGFTGCANSKYAVRMTTKLSKLGYGVIRVNLRGAGESTYTCHKLYHAGKTDDIKTVLEWINEKYPEIPITLLGFSLGGNVVLKLSAEELPSDINVDSSIAVSTPLELKLCTLLLSQPHNKLFNDHFVTFVLNEVKTLRKYHPERDYPTLINITNIYEFDDQFTAPMNEYKNADDYYAQNSSYQFLTKLRHPTFLMHALDDPFIAKDSYLDLPDHPHLFAHITSNGGHLGWLGCWPQVPFRWMDHELLSAITNFHLHRTFYDQ